MKRKLQRLVDLMETYQGKPKTTIDILQDYNKKYKWQYTKMEMAQTLTKNKRFERSTAIGYSPRNDSGGYRIVNTWILRRD